MFILFFYRVQHEYYAHEPCNNTVDETSLVHGGVKVFCLKTVAYRKGIIPDQYDMALTALSFLTSPRTSHYSRGHKVMSSCSIQHLCGG